MKVGVTFASPHAQGAVLPGKRSVCCWLAQQWDGSAGHSPCLFPARPWQILQLRNIALSMLGVNKGTGMDQINDSSFFMAWKGAESQGLVLGSSEDTIEGVSQPH